VLGGSYIFTGKAPADPNGVSLNAISWDLRGTFPSNGFSILFRGLWTYSGNPSGNNGLFNFNSPAQFGRLSVEHQTSGNLLIQMYGERIELIFNFTVAFSPTSGSEHDILIKWDGQSGSNMSVYADGVLLGTGAASFASGDMSTFISDWTVGTGVNYSAGYVHAVELAINDDSTWGPSSVTLADDSTGSLNGESRTQFVKVDAYNKYAIPSAGIVKTGEVINGVTGTYDGSDRWTDPGVTNVAAGVSYKANSTSNNKTGTLNSIEVVTESLQAEIVGGPLTGVLKG